jgi:hypothetical protein
MADIAQVLATGGTTIVGVAVGAGLTYWLGALNRRHQEAREDETRWYEARREAYAAMLMASSLHFRSMTDESEKLAEKSRNELTAAISAVRLVGSPAAIEAADNMYSAILEAAGVYGQELIDTLKQVVQHPEQGVTDEEVNILTEKFALLRLNPTHLASAWAAFEEAARRDLGQGPSGRSTAKQGTA